MRLKLVSAPAEEVISTATAKAHLRVSGTAEDAQIAALASAARLHVDGATGWLGRALVTQTWDLSLDAWPAAGIVQLPLPPLQSVTHIKYRDGAGDEQTLDPATYQVDLGGETGRLAPQRGYAWPSTADQLAAITIRFIAGYGAASAVPAPISQALLLIIADLYENREGAIAGAAYAENPAVNALLLPFRRNWFG